MTEAEITLLRSLAEADVVTFMPEDDTAAAVVRFEAPGQRGSAARCTEAGREALRLLGE